MLHVTIVSAISLRLEYSAITWFEVFTINITQDCSTNGNSQSDIELTTAYPESVKRAQSNSTEFYRKLANCWRNNSFLLFTIRPILTIRYIPDECRKTGNIVAIFKKGDKDRAENYRPIFLLTNTSTLTFRTLYIDESKRLPVAAY